MATVQTRHHGDGYEAPTTGSEKRAVSDPPRIRRFVNPDQLFAELDGESISAGMVRGKIEIYGVRDDAGSRWVQLSVIGQTSQMVTLRLPVGEGARGAFAALSSVLQTPSPRLAAVSNCPMYLDDPSVPSCAH